MDSLFSTIPEDKDVGFYTIDEVQSAVCIWFQPYIPTSLWGLFLEATAGKFHDCKIHFVLRVPGIDNIEHERLLGALDIEQIETYISVYKTSEGNTYVFAISWS